MSSINKIHAKGYFPALEKQGTKTFKVAVQQLPIDLVGQAFCCKTSLAAPLDAYRDRRCFAFIVLSWELFFIFQDSF